MDCCFTRRDSWSSEDDDDDDDDDVEATAFIKYNDHGEECGETKKALAATFDCRRNPKRAILLLLFFVAIAIILWFFVLIIVLGKEFSSPNAVYIYAIHEDGQTLHSLPVRR